MARVTEALEGVTRLDEEAIDRAMALFDFAQHAADAWRGSTSATRRETLDAVSVNRTPATQLFVSKRQSPST